MGEIFINYQEYLEQEPQWDHCPKDGKELNLDNCLVCKDIEPCDTYAGRQFKINKDAIKYFGFDVSGITTMEQIQKYFAMEWRDAICYGVTHK